ncbi:MAG TPA: RHS repeat domain-containing protein [Candidatus Obscuribacterales bacterium]
MSEADLHRAALLFEAKRAKQRKSERAREISLPKYREQLNFIETQRDLRAEERLTAYDILEHLYTDPQYCEQLFGYSFDRLPMKYREEVDLLIEHYYKPVKNSTEPEFTREEAEDFVDLLLSALSRDASNNINRREWKLYLELRQRQETEANLLDHLITDRFEADHRPPSSHDDPAVTRLVRFLFSPDADFSTTDVDAAELPPEVTPPQPVHGQLPPKLTDAELFALRMEEIRKRSAASRGETQEPSLQIADTSVAPPYEATDAGAAADPRIALRQLIQDCGSTADATFLDKLVAAVPANSVGKLRHIMEIVEERYPGEILTCLEQASGAPRPGVNDEGARYLHSFLSAVKTALRNHEADAALIRQLDETASQLVKLPAQQFPYGNPLWRLTDLGRMPQTGEFTLVHPGDKSSLVHSLRQGLGDAAAGLRTWLGSVRDALKLGPPARRLIPPDSDRVQPALPDSVVVSRESSLWQRFARPDSAPADQTLKLEYTRAEDGEVQLRKVTGPDCIWTTADGVLWSIEYSDGQVGSYRGAVSVTADGALRFKDPSGTRVEYADGRVQITEHSGGVRKYQAGASKPYETIDAVGNIYRFHYDAQGEPDAIDFPNGARAERLTAGKWKVTMVGEEDEISVTYSVDERGILTAVKPDGSRTEFRLDGSQAVLDPEKVTLIHCQMDVQRGRLTSLAECNFIGEPERCLLRFVMEEFERKAAAAGMQQSQVALIYESLASNLEMRPYVDAAQLIEAVQNRLKQEQLPKRPPEAADKFRSRLDPAGNRIIEMADGRIWKVDQADNLMEFRLDGARWTRHGELWMNDSGELFHGKAWVRPDLGFLRIERPDGKVELHDRSAAVRIWQGGLLTETIDANGRHSRYEYDTSSDPPRLTRSHLPDGLIIEQLDFKNALIRRSDGSMEHILASHEVFPDGSLVRVEFAKEGGISRILEVCLDGTAHIRSDQARITAVENLDLGLETAKLRSLADWHFKEPAERARFLTDLDILREKAVLERTLTPDQVAEALHHIARIFETYESHALPLEQRRVLATQLLYQAAHPESVEQGPNPTCNIATIESRLLATNPAHVIKAVVDIATTGRYVGSDGKVFDFTNPDTAPCRQPDANSLCHVTPISSLKALRKIYPAKLLRGVRDLSQLHPLVARALGRRTFASQIFQNLGVNIHTRMNGEGVFDGAAIITAHDTLMPFDGMPAGALEPISNLISGKDEAGFVFQHAYETECLRLRLKGRGYADYEIDEMVARNRVVTFTSRDDLAQKLQEYRQRTGNASVIIFVHTSNDPFWRDSGRGTKGGVGGNTGGYHFVRIQEFMTESRRVAVDNQWGKRAEHIGHKAITLDTIYQACWDHNNQEACTLVALLENKPDKAATAGPEAGPHTETTPSAPTSPAVSDVTGTHGVTRTIRDAAGRVREVEISLDGHPVRYRDSGGVEWTSIDGQVWVNPKTGQMRKAAVAVRADGTLSVTDASGTTIHCPDGSTEFVDASGATRTLDPDGRIVRMTDAGGHVLQIARDETGQVTAVSSSDGRFWTRADGYWVYKQQDGGGEVILESFVLKDDGLTISVLESGEACTRGLDGSIIWSDSSGRSWVESVDYAAENRRIQHLAQWQMDGDPAFTQSIKELECRVRSAGTFESSEQEIGRVFHSVAELLTSTEAKLRSGRESLAIDILNNCARPASINQGYHYACNVAVLEARMFNRSPSEAAELIKNIALHGYFHTTDGRKVQLRDADLEPDPEVVDEQYAQMIFQSGDPAAILRQQEFNRNHADQLFQIAAAGLLYATGVKSSKFRYCRTRQHGSENVQEGLWRVSPDTGEPVQLMSLSPNLTPEDLHEIYYALSRKEKTIPFVVVGPDCVPEDPTKVIQSRSNEDFERALASLESSKAFPAVVMVHSWQPPFHDPARRQETAKLQLADGHAVTILGILTNNGVTRVEIDNQRGIDRDLVGEKALTPDALFEAMRLSSEQKSAWHEPERLQLVLEDSQKPVTERLDALHKLYSFMHANNVPPAQLDRVYFESLKGVLVDLSRRWASMDASEFGNEYAELISQLRTRGWTGPHDLATAENIAKRITTVYEKALTANAAQVKMAPIPDGTQIAVQHDSPSVLDRLATAGGAGSGVKLNNIMFAFHGFERLANLFAGRQDIQERLMSLAPHGRCLTDLWSFVSEDPKNRIELVAGELARGAHARQLNEERLLALQKLHRHFPPDSDMMRRIHAIEDDYFGEFDLQALANFVRTPQRKALVEAEVSRGTDAWGLQIPRLAALDDLQHIFPLDSQTMQCILRINAGSQELRDLAEWIRQSPGNRIPLVERYAAVPTVERRHLDYRRLDALQIVSTFSSADILDRILEFEARFPWEFRLSELHSFLEQNPPDHASVLAREIMQASSPEQLRKERLLAISNLEGRLGQHSATMARLRELEAHQSKGDLLESLSRFISEGSSTRTAVLEREVARGATLKQLEIHRLAGLDNVASVFGIDSAIVGHLLEAESSNRMSAAFLHSLGRYLVDASAETCQVRSEIVTEAVEAGAGPQELLDYARVCVVPEALVRQLMQAVKQGGLDVPTVRGYLRDIEAGPYFLELLTRHLAVDQVLTRGDAERLLTEAREMARTKSQGSRADWGNGWILPGHSQESSLRESAQILAAVAETILQRFPEDKPIVLLGRDAWPLVPLLRSQGRQVQYFLWSRLQIGERTTTEQWLKEVPPGAVVIDTGYAGSILDDICRVDPTVEGHLVVSTGKYPQLWNVDHKQVVATIERIPKVPGRSASYTQRDIAVCRSAKRDVDEALKTQRETLEYTEDLLRAMGLPAWYVWRYRTYVGLTPQERLGLSSQADIERHYGQIKASREKNAGPKLSFERNATS